MYLHHFNLRRKPFELHPDPELFFPSASHRLAASMLEYAIVARSDLCLITGEVGSGKTTLLQSLISQLKGSETVGLVSNTHRAFGDLLDLILMAFEVDPAAGNGRTRTAQLMAFIQAEHLARRHPVLVIDEAQNLSIDDLEAIRVLSNVNGSTDKRLQIVLVGQPELRDKLKRRELRQLVQRIPVDFDLRPLTRRDVGCYMAHRLTRCGGRPDLFTPSAVDRVADHSHGVPRVINVLCDLALVYAYAELVPHVSDAIVEEVVRDKRAEGLFWFEHEHYEV